MAIAHELGLLEQVPGAAGWLMQPVGASSSEWWPNT